MQSPINDHVSQNQGDQNFSYSQGIQDTYMSLRLYCMNFGCDGTVRNNDQQYYLYPYMSYAKYSAHYQVSLS